MGLTVAMRLVTRCGGRFGVITEPESGTSVHMTFAPPKGGMPAEQVSPDIPRTPLDVLLVEDDEAARAGRGLGGHVDVPHGPADGEAAALAAASLRGVLLLLVAALVLEAQRARAG